MKRSQTFSAIAMLIIAGTLAACDRKGETTTSTSTSSSRETERTTSAPVTSKPAPSPSAPTTPDTTGKTPMDQSESPAQIAITAEIRKSIIADKAMSMNAQNCKIITDKTGLVTLRGKVDSQAEKDSIEAKAKAVSGVTMVDNQLEVKTN